MSKVATRSADRQWYIVGRWQEFGGEARANFVRIAAVAVFYSLQLVHFHLLAPADQRDVAFHRGATVLAVAGVFAALAVQLCLQRRVFPASLKYLSTALDVALISGLAALGDGAHSPMRLALFLVIALAALRFSLGLVWCTTLATMLSYLGLVGWSDAVWFDADHSVRPIEQLVTLASLALTGIVMGQVIRQVRLMAEEYDRRLRGATSEADAAVPKGIA
ncbi:MAG: hypothetical protein AB7F89_09880 [Pirellulaceae bacterium]